MNVHAVEVEGGADRPLLSGFHALYSIGGFLGAALMATMLTVALIRLPARWSAPVSCLGAMFVAWPRLLPAISTESRESYLFARPRGVVILVATLAAAMFLVEGAMLDWSALLISGESLLTRNQAALG
ncbi:hypothetical protein GGD66_006926 [Bradyrhizobium sp. CIR48]|uniref:hypothetical protein n=1 Tax=Bradyrhizobium sp. CIR48 TaxID=2663840 RepID=UPI00180162A1|nr:hypothetical protein [Bradyrhizobium sp. CIR48]MBB4428339.1 hypothetical protein [Bradyrhizobium sp. CIR48]